MNYLSAHFRQDELACTCCEQCNVSDRLLDALEDLRAKINEESEESIPLQVSSCCRCFKKNKNVSKFPTTSYHLFDSKHSTKAADVWTYELTPIQLYEHALTIPELKNGGIGLYKSIIHVDVRGKKARWGRIDGEYVAIETALKHFGGQDDRGSKGRN